MNFLLKNFLTKKEVNKICNLQKEINDKVELQF